MKKVVIIIDNSIVQDVLVDSKEHIEFMVVDFDRQSLDQSVANLLTKPYEFGDFVALADIYTWDGVYDPKRVKEIFQAQNDLNAGKLIPGDAYTA